MPVSYNTFERLKDKGMAHFRSGDDKAEQPYLTQRAHTMLEIAAELFFFISRPVLSDAMSFHDP